MVRLTLLELVTTLAVVMVLAALAIPQVQHARLSAKVAEARPNVQSIADAVVAYDVITEEMPGAMGGMLSPRDLAILDGRPVPWFAFGPNWANVSWLPDGSVRCSYMFDLAWPLGQVDYQVLAFCDVDDDSRFLVESVTTGAATTTCVPGPGTCF